MVVAAFLAIGLQDLNRGGLSSYAINKVEHGRSYTVTFKAADFSPRGRTVFWQQVFEEGAARPPRERGFFHPAFRKGSRVKSFVGLGGGHAWTFSDIKKITAAELLRQENTELVDLKVRVDGKNWPIPSWAYEDLLDPNLGTDYVSSTLSKDGRRLVIVMMGSDGAGAYQVRWTVSRGGVVRRKFDSIQ